MTEINIIDEGIFNEGNSAKIQSQRTLMEVLNELDGFDDLVDFLIKTFGILP